MSLSSHSSSSGHSSGRGGFPSSSQPSGYFAHHHEFGNGDQNAFIEDDEEGERKTGTVSVQNGAINLHIPCAFSYAYDVPVPPQPTRKGKGQSKSERSDQHVPKSGNKYPPKVSKSSAMPKEGRPFYTTVKSGQMYKAKNLASSSRKAQNKTSVVWDFHSGERIPFQAVDYGQELYEQAARNLAKTLQEQKLTDSKASTSSDIENNCFDFSKPGIHSSRQTTKALEKAMEQLKTLPAEVEQLLRKDKRFEPVIMAKATRSLNVPRNTKVYKDLIPVDPNPDVRTEAENIIQAEIRRSIEASRQPSRTRDSEPKLEDFQSNSFTRIRPQAVPSPPKPSSGIHVDMSHDFDTIETERRLEDDSNRM